MKWIQKQNLILLMMTMIVMKFKELKLMQLENKMKMLLN